MSWSLAIVVGLAILSGIVLFALLAPVRFRLEADESGAVGRFEWLGLALGFDLRRNLMEVRFAGLRLGRRRLSDERTEPRRSEPRRRRPRLSSLDPLLREARIALQRLRLERLRLEGTVATGDPALTGALYGFGAAATGALRGVWPQARVRLDADFEAERPTGRLELALSVRPVRLVDVGWRVGRILRQDARRGRTPKPRGGARLERKGSWTYVRSSTG